MELFTADAISRDIKITSNRETILDFNSTDLGSKVESQKQRHKFSIGVIQNFIDAKKDKANQLSINVFLDSLQK